MGAHHQMWKPKAWDLCFGGIYGSNLLDFLTSYEAYCRTLTVPPSSQLPKLWAQTEPLPSAILPSEPLGIGIGGGGGGATKREGGGACEGLLIREKKGGGGRTEQVLAMLKGEDKKFWSIF